MELISLKALCARRICFLNNFDRLIALIPTNLGKQIKSLYYSISQTKKLYEAFRNLPEKYFVINSHAFEVDRFLSVLSMEKILTKSQYFTLCAIHAMDEETARVFASMTDDDKRELGDENAVVNVRIGELSRIPPIPFYYETAALVAARNGWLEAFHKYLSKVEQDETERVTARCVLKAIVHQNYHIANATPVENFGDEFYSEFPDGRVSPKFFASLFMPGLLRREIGRKIARDLIQWLPVLDVDMLRHRLDGEELSPELFLECANLLDERRLSNSVYEKIDSITNRLLPILSEGKDDNIAAVIEKQAKKWLEKKYARSFERSFELECDDNEEEEIGRRDSAPSKKDDFHIMAECTVGLASNVKILKCVLKRNELIKKIEVNEDQVKVYIFTFRIDQNRENQIMDEAKKYGIKLKVSNDST